MIRGIHHIAIIAGDYAAGKQFYTEVLGCQIIRETYRAERNSYKLDLALNGVYAIELFSFPEARERASWPEARGLRHLAFAVEDLDVAIAHLHKHGVAVQPIRIDELTQQRFCFFTDPGGQPLEFYEVR